MLPVLIYKKKPILLCQIIIVVALFLSLDAAKDDDDGDNDGSSDTMVAGVVYKSLNTLAGTFGHEIDTSLKYCIKDSKKDWNEAFKFDSDLTFLTNCIKETQGGISRRICTSAEINFYFNSFASSEAQNNFLKPNLNCNLSAWVSGCEPGWACSIGGSKKIDLSSQVIPSRKLDCHPCCEGFFCPRGLTCMIPCPLGAYCPRGILNKTTGICDPYQYQLPRGKPNHTCGGADMWSDVTKSGEIFCPAGYYCPSTIQKISCSSGVGKQRHWKHLR